MKSKQFSYVFICRKISQICCTREKISQFFSLLFLYASAFLMWFDSCKQMTLPHLVCILQIPTKLIAYLLCFFFCSSAHNSRYRKFYWFVCSSKMADDEQFSLCWNNFNTNLSAGFHESLCRGDLVDVSLAAEGQIVKAHRLVLSVCSPFFRKMFTQMPSNTHAIGKYYEPNGVAMPD